MLHCIDMTPLVVIYVVQYSYYQIEITKNINKPHQTFLFEEKLTNSLLYCIDGPPLVLIYVVEYSYYQI